MEPLTTIRSWLKVVTLINHIQSRSLLKHPSKRLTSDRQTSDSSPSKRKACFDKEQAPGTPTSCSKKTGETSTTGNRSEMKPCADVMTPQSAKTPTSSASHNKLADTPAARKKLLMTPVQQSSALFEKVKSALHTQQPTEVLCREKEISSINTFIDSRVNGGSAKSLYISGAPGTGKTAVIKHVLQQRSQDIGQTVFINSMTVQSAFAMFKAIAVEMLGSKAAASVRTSKHAEQLIVNHLTSQNSRKLVLLVLDEMDQLDSKHQQVLYTIFEWPSIAKSRLLLIGIANSLDLTDRILPRLNVNIDCRPELLHFQPYTREQIVTVLDSRLQKTPEVYKQVLDRSALTYCARKVSAVAGDMRKALDICRRSLEFTQLSNRKQNLLKLQDEESDPVPLNSSTKPSVTAVGIRQVASVVDEVYGSASSTANPNSFPLQQKLVVSTLLLLMKSSKVKEFTLASSCCVGNYFNMNSSIMKVLDSYCRVCKKQDVAPSDQSEFVSLCQLLECRGLIILKKAKESRLRKISLKMDPKELEFAMQDKLLISSVLDKGL
ncbi:CDC6 [Bugula neritina]|uniref:Cell division control protein n=1 Tax=Bugula neritina TaxID=10212 RepID=A0A7J7J2A3_BUGNE|nr:CDC6 [Bugula neritina]